MLESLARDETLDGYNDGLTVDEVPGGSVEPRLSRELAQGVEFTPEELATVDGGWAGWAVGGAAVDGRAVACGVNGGCMWGDGTGHTQLGWLAGSSIPVPDHPPPAAQAEKSFNEGLGMAGKELLAEGVARLAEDANALEPFFLNLAAGNE